MKRDVARLLRKAAGIMLKGGMVRGTLWARSRTNPDGSYPHCALGAIYEATGETHIGCNYRANGVAIEAIKQVGVMIADKIPEAGIIDHLNAHMKITRQSTPLACIHGWNNELAADADEVACMLNATAELLEEEDLELCPKTNV